MTTPLLSEWEIPSLSGASQLTSKPFMYAAMVVTLLSSCIEPKGLSQESPQSARIEHKTTDSDHKPMLKIMETEIRAVIRQLHKNKNIYPLTEINPLLQKELDTICTHIQNDLIAGRIFCSLPKVKTALSSALWKIFWDIPEGDIQIGLTPVTTNEKWAVFAEISAHLWGRSYTSTLMIPTDKYMNKTFPRPIGAWEFATLIRQSMKDEFLLHIRHKLEATLSMQTISDDSIPDILENMRPLLLDEEEWFRAIGHTLSGPVTISPIGDKDLIEIIITTNSPEWELRFTF